MTCSEPGRLALRMNKGRAQVRTSVSASLSDVLTLDAKAEL